MLIIELVGLSLLLMLFAAVHSKCNSIKSLLDDSGWLGSGASNGLFFDRDCFLFKCFGDSQVLHMVFPRQRQMCIIARL